MSTTRGFLLLCVAISCICQIFSIQAESLNRMPTDTREELATCEEQLSRYRKFLLQAIITFEDVCDAYSAHPGGVNPFHYYQPPEQRTEIWAFFKLLMAQFNDLEFMNNIREAVVARCRIKSELQREDKRNSVILGKKERFHSWGGKRSPLLVSAFPMAGTANSGTEEHSTESNSNYFN